MKQKCTIFFFLFLIIRPLTGQVSSNQFLEFVEKNNKRIQTAQLRLEADRKAARTGLFPEDPELEIGYLYGEPSEIGNRKDFGISQSFHLPTVYFQHADMADLKKERSMISFAILRQNVLVEARKTWLMAIFLKQKKNVLEKRQKDYRQILENNQLKFDTGEINQLELNQSKLHHTILMQELEQLNADIMVNQKEILAITGGNP
mgnify:CR=1 FL=1